MCRTILANFVYAKRVFSFLVLNRIQVEKQNGKTPAYFAGKKKNKRVLKC